MSDHNPAYQPGYPSGYQPEDVLRLAKRYRNTRRSYLLVNPLQAKHLPVSPARALAMMDTLGERLRARFPQAGLVIGFAETATAIGAAAAARIGGACRYLQTTREAGAAGAEWLCFLEEHSHAVDQKLDGAYLNQWAAVAPPVIFVDDEISTGKTLLNAVTRMRAQYPALARVPVAAASVLSRLTPDNDARLAAAGIVCESLVRLPEADYTARVAPWLVEPPLETPQAVGVPQATDNIQPGGLQPGGLQQDSLQPDGLQSVGLQPGGLQAESFQVAGGPVPKRWTAGAPLPDPRHGVIGAEYRNACEALGEAVARQGFVADGQKVLVLGTEECMYPALIAGAVLERRFPGARVFCHATTRSPIGIGTGDGYPIREGYRLRSFYEPERITYLYNPARYDVALILTDAPEGDGGAEADVAAALGVHGCGRLIVVRGGAHV